MRFIKYLCILAIAFASCRASRSMVPVSNEETQPVVVAAVSPVHSSISAPDKEVSPELKEEAADSQTNTASQMENSKAIIATTAAGKHITSFTQMKEMARSGEIEMSNKDVKTLNRLEKHYKGNYDQFRADAFEFNTKAKIIGGIGLLGLLLGIITGSAFGWFLFIVAALAFLLRYLNIIAF